MAEDGRAGASLAPPILLRHRTSEECAYDHSSHYCVPPACIVALALTAFGCRTPPPQVPTAPPAAQTAAAPGSGSQPLRRPAPRRGVRQQRPLRGGRPAGVVAAARLWLDERAKTATKPAIALDIDETSLSNWPPHPVNGWGRVLNGPGDLQQGPCWLPAFQATGQSKAIAPTLSLARHARELGVAVFFITGRPANLREATERNLREQGYEWTRRRAAARRRALRQRRRLQGARAAQAHRAGLHRRPQHGRPAERSRAAATPSGRSSSRTRCISCLSGVAVGSVAGCSFQPAILPAR